MGLVSSRGRGMGCRGSEMLEIGLRNEGHDFLPTLLNSLNKIGV